MNTRTRNRAIYQMVVSSDESLAAIGERFGLSRQRVQAIFRAQLRIEHPERAGELIGMGLRAAQVQLRREALPSPANSNHGATQHA